MKQIKIVEGWWKSVLPTQHFPPHIYIYHPHYRVTSKEIILRMFPFFFYLLGTRAFESSFMNSFGKAKAKQNKKIHFFCQCHNFESSLHLYAPFIIVRLTV